jgi:putative heme-binding domain-containing protein
MRLLVITGSLTLALLLAHAARPVAAQHATAEDISDGGRAYGESCVVCHGPDGNLIAGIDFGRGLLRREFTDAELVGVIRNGIPNTPMPPTPAMSVEQAERIVAYLRSWPEEAQVPVTAGDRARGRDLFFGEGNCDSCHAVNGRGARHGPDLTSIGRERRAVELQASLLDPNAVVDPTGRSYRVTRANGEVVTGRLLNHDTFTVQLLDTDDRLRSFAKTGLAEHGFVDSPMPAFRGVLSSQQIADLVSYLTSLQGLPR